MNLRTVVNGALAGTLALTVGCLSGNGDGQGTGDSGACVQAAQLCGAGPQPEGAVCTGETLAFAACIVDRGSCDGAAQIACVGGGDLVDAGAGAGGGGQPGNNGGAPGGNPGDNGGEPGNNGGVPGNNGGGPVEQGSEDTDARCMDGVDNDADGHVDCDDFDCTRSDTVTVRGGGGGSDEDSDATCMDGVVGAGPGEGPGAVKAR